MEHCECEMLIADEFHLNIWSEFDGSMDVSERLTVLKARPFYSCDSVVSRTARHRDEEELVSKRGREEEERN